MYSPSILEAYFIPLFLDEHDDLSDDMQIRVKDLLQEVLVPPSFCVTHTENSVASSQSLRYTSSTESPAYRYTIANRAKTSTRIKMCIQCPHPSTSHPNSYAIAHRPLLEPRHEDEFVKSMPLPSTSIVIRPCCINADSSPLVNSINLKPSPTVFSRDCDTYGYVCTSPSRSSFMRKAGRGQPLR